VRGCRRTPSWARSLQCRGEPLIRRRRPDDPEFFDASMASLIRTLHAELRAR